MLTHFSSFSFPITAHFSLIFEPIRDQVCLLYPFLRSIHFQILMLLEISMPRGTFSPGYLGEPGEPLLLQFVNNYFTISFLILFFMYPFVLYSPYRLIKASYPLVSNSVNAFLLLPGIA